MIEIYKKFDKTIPMTLYCEFHIILIITKGLGFQGVQYTITRARHTLPLYVLWVHNPRSRICFFFDRLKMYFFRREVAPL
jgi:hypothetical protein